jgi:DNA-binding transcriptional LysR family regulator
MTLILEARPFHRFWELFSIEHHIARLTVRPSFRAETHRQPNSPRDLLAHNCLVQSTDPIWHFGKGKLGTKVKVPRAFSSNSYLVLRTAAMKGLGIALLPYRTGTTSRMKRSSSS